MIFGSCFNGSIHPHGCPVLESLSLLNNHLSRFKWMKSNEKYVFNHSASSYVGWYIILSGPCTIHHAICSITIYKSILGCFDMCVYIHRRYWSHCVSNAQWFRYNVLPFTITLAAPVKIIMAKNGIGVCCMEISKQKSILILFQLQTFCATSVGCGSTVFKSI